MTTQAAQDPGQSQSPETVAPLVLVGLSAGGMAPLATLLASLEADFRAGILVTMHMGESRRTHLPEILQRETRLRVDLATDGDRIEPGVVLLAPPGSHMRVEDGTVDISRGPRHNGYRPSIDVLFMSGARSRHDPLIAVLLSGARSDGSAGVAAVKLAGGWTAVQDPEEATFAAMPLSAMENVDVDAVLGMDKMGAWLVDRLDASAERIRRPLAGEEEVYWVPTGFSCPDCGGVLWKGDVEGLPFRCRIGHEWSETALEGMSASRIENGMEVALRIIDEQIAFDRRLLQHAAGSDRQRAVHRIEGRLQERQDLANELEAILERLKGPPAPRGPLLASGSRGTD